MKQLFSILVIFVAAVFFFGCDRSSNTVAPEESSNTAFLKITFVTPSTYDINVEKNQLVVSVTSVDGKISSYTLENPKPTASDAGVYYIFHDSVAVEVPEYGKKNTYSIRVSYLGFSERANTFSPSQDVSHWAFINEQSPYQFASDGSIVISIDAAGNTSLYSNTRDYLYPIYIAASNTYSYDFGGPVTITVDHLIATSDGQTLWQPLLIVSSYFNTYRTAVRYDINSSNPWSVTSKFLTGGYSEENLRIRAVVNYSWGGTSVVTNLLAIDVNGWRNPPASRVENGYTIFQLPFSGGGKG